jgi:hypothetical protein
MRNGGPAEGIALLDSISRPIPRDPPPLPNPRPKVLLVQLSDF